MKKIFTTLFISAVACFSAMAQDTAKHISQDKAEKWMAGKWVVEDKNLLPVVETGMTEYMRDTLVFGADKSFKNTLGGNAAKVVWEVNAAEMLLVILNVQELDGIEYQVASITEKRLAIVIPNRQRTDYIELVYKKITPVN